MSSMNEPSAQKSISLLPDEVWLGVLSHIDEPPSHGYASPTLLNLALVSRRLHCLADQQLYHCINLHQFSLQSNLTRILEKLERTVTVNQALAELILDVSLIWTHPSQKSLQKLDDFLAKLPRLRHLEFNGLGVIFMSDEQYWRPNFWNMNPARNLENAIVITYIFLVEDAYRFLLCPSLRQLTNFRLYDGSPATAWIIQNKTMSIVDWDLGGVPVLVETLKALFPLTPHLKKLRLAPPVVATPRRPRGRLRDDIVDSHLSPGSLQSVLEPLASQLTSLTVDTQAFDYKLGHDSSRLDLSNFTSLTCAYLSSECFFPSLSPKSHRGHVHALLPSNIRHLTISFDVDTGLFFTVDQLDKKGRFRSLLDSIGEDTQPLLGELWSYKDKSYPNLETFTVVEPGKTRARLTYEALEYDSNTSCLAKSQEANVMCSLVLRAPHRWRQEDSEDDSE